MLMHRLARLTRRAAPRAQRGQATVETVVILFCVTLVVVGVLAFVVAPTVRDLLASVLPGLTR